MTWYDSTTVAWIGGTMPWVYVLHLDTPLHHARHYSGCTKDLTERLIVHATGHGARFTEVLYLKGITWELGGLFQTKEGYSLRAIETLLKDQRNAPRYCTICTRNPTRVPLTTPIPVALAPVRTTADAIACLAARQAAAKNGTLNPS